MGSVFLTEVYGRGLGRIVGRESEGFWNEWV